MPKTQPKLTSVQPLLPEDAAARNFQEVFRKRLKDMRKKAGYTQEELCELIGVPVANYKHMEGKRASAFPLYKLPKLSLVLRQSCDYILTGHEARMSQKDHNTRVA